MTRKEFYKAYSAARKKTLRLSVRGINELKKIYNKAGDMVAEVIADVKARQLSDITLEAQTAISRQLELGANLIRGKMSENLSSMMRKAAGYVTGVDAQYLKTIMPGIRGVTSIGIDAVYAAVNERVVRSLVNRMFQDGYTLSDRIWRVGSDYRDNISRVIGSGFAQGRDPVKIARDIKGYIKGGKTYLAKSYGPRLKAGTHAWYSRIRKDIDYRAIRLVRSELYMSLQEAGKESGRANPGALDLYNWVLNPHRQQWNCVCPENARNGPYTYNNIPPFAHPNDMCRIEPVLRERDNFLYDLQSWANFEPVPYLDQWHSEFYSLLA